MKLKLASTPLRREHAAATRRLVNILVERLAPGLIQILRNPS
jgi:hypothetical protein